MDKKDLSQIFGGTVPPAEEVKEPEQKEEEKKEEPAAIVEPEKKEPEKEKKDVDWEKRNKDTFKAFQETQKLNKELQAKLDSALSRLDEHDKELFPDRVPEKKEDKVPEKKEDDTRWQERVILSEELVRSTHPDYDAKIGTDGDKEAPYAKALEENPSLYNRVKAAKNPALEAYNIAKEYEFQTNYGRTPEQIKAKLKEEILAELAKEQKEKAKASDEDDNDDKPQTLRGKGGSAPAGAKASVGAHRPLSALFNR